MNASKEKSPGAIRGTTLHSGSPHGVACSSASMKQKGVYSLSQRNGWVWRNTIDCACPLNTIECVHKLGPLSVSLPQIHPRRYSREGQKRHMLLPFPTR